MLVAVGAALFNCFAPTLYLPSQLLTFAPSKAKVRRISLKTQSSSAILPGFCISGLASSRLILSAALMRFFFGGLAARPNLAANVSSSDRSHPWMAVTMKTSSLDLGLGRKAKVTSL